MDRDSLCVPIGNSKYRLPVSQCDCTLGCLLPSLPPSFPVPGSPAAAFPLKSVCVSRASSFEGTAGGLEGMAGEADRDREEDMGGGWRWDDGLGLGGGRPRDLTRPQSWSMCSCGTTSSRSPPRRRIGTARGILGICVDRPGRMNIRIRGE